MATSADYEFMARALQLARRGLYTTDPNPRVGCVVVRDGEIVGEGWHARAGEAHAEIHALQAAGERARDATVYVTLEPCCHQGRTPPCTQALIDAGPSRVVAGLEDPNPRVSGQGLAKLRAAGIEVESGVLAEQSGALNPGFVSRMARGRPFVRCKLAMSLDGRTAMASGQSQWITGEAARADVHRLRACSSAIVTGIGTVLADDPSLTVRLDDEAPAGGWRQPLRVVLDPHLSTPTGARMLALPGRTIVATAVEEPGIAEQLQAGGAEVLVLPGARGGVDLQVLMERLAGEEINEVLLETGATLSGAMLRAQLIDELVLYMAPHLMGDGARGLFHLPGLDRMEQRAHVEILDMRAVGRDWRVTAVPVYSRP